MITDLTLEFTSPKLLFSIANLKMIKSYVTLTLSMILFKDNIHK